MEFLFISAFIALVWWGATSDMVASDDVADLKLKLKVVKDAKEAGWDAAFRLDAKYDVLLHEYNELVRRINRHGGESLFDDKNSYTSEQFSEDELVQMLKLCHPDRHDNNATSTQITQKILELRKQ